MAEIDKGYLGNARLKRSGVQINWTQKMIDEYIRCKEDPVYFAMNYMKIINVDEGLVPYSMYDFQQNMLKTMTNNRFTIVCTARQVGKSTTACAFVLHQIIFNDNKTWAILANKAETAREILARVQLAYEHLPKWLQHGVVEFNKGSFELENGSRVLASATSSSAIRGYSLAGLILDEAAFIEGWDEFFASVYPTISSGKTTKLILVSTPNGMNHFYKIWYDANRPANDPDKNKFSPVKVLWDEVPGRDLKWKAETIANTSEEQFLQEHACEFLGNSRTLIGGWKLNQIVFETPMAKISKARIFRRNVPGHKYVMTVDVSHGKGIDYSAFTVFDVTKTPYETVCTFYENTVNPITYTQIIHNIAKFYSDAYVLVESNDVGSQVVQILYHDYEYENVISSTAQGRAGKKPTWAGGVFSELGVRTTKTVKSVGCSLLKPLIEQDHLIVRDYDQVRELSTFSKKGFSYEAEDGCNDDLAMTLVLFAWLTDSDLFKEITSSNIRVNLRDVNDEAMLEDLVPFGFMVDGTEENELTDEEKYSLAEDLYSGGSTINSKMRGKKSSMQIDDDVDQDEFFKF